MSAELPRLKQQEPIVYDDHAERTRDHLELRRAMDEEFSQGIDAGRVEKAKQDRFLAGKAALDKMSTARQLGIIPHQFAASALDGLATAGVGMAQLAGFVATSGNPRLMRLLGVMDMTVPQILASLGSDAESVEQLVLGEEAQQAHEATEGMLGVGTGTSGVAGHLLAFIAGPQGQIVNRLGQMSSNAMQRVPVVQRWLLSDKRYQRALGSIAEKYLPAGVGFGAAAAAATPGTLEERWGEGVTNLMLGTAFPLATAAGAWARGQTQKLSKAAFEKRWPQMMAALQGRPSSIAGGSVEGAVIAEMSAMGLSITDAEATKPLVWALITGDREQINAAARNVLHTALAMGGLKGVKTSNLAAYKRMNPDEFTRIPTEPVEAEVMRQGWVEKPVTSFMGEDSKMWWSLPGFEKGRFRYGRREDGKPFVHISPELAEAMGTKTPKRGVLKSDRQAEKVLREIVEWTKMQAIEARSRFHEGYQTGPGEYLGEGRQWRYINDKVYSRSTEKEGSPWIEEADVPPSMRPISVVRIKPDPYLTASVEQLRAWAPLMPEKLHQRGMEAVANSLERSRPSDENVPRETLALLGSPEFAEGIRLLPIEAVQQLTEVASGASNADYAREILRASQLRSQEREEAQDVVERGAEAEPHRSPSDLPPGSVVPRREAGPGERPAEAIGPEQPDRPGVDPQGRPAGQAEGPVAKRAENPSRQRDLTEFKAKLRARLETKAAAKGEPAPDLRFRLQPGGMKMDVLSRDPMGKWRKLKTEDVPQGPEAGFAGEWLTEPFMMALKAASVPAGGSAQILNKAFIEPWSKPIINSVRDLGSKDARTIGHRAQRSIDEAELKLGSINDGLKDALVRTSNNPLPRRNWTHALQGRTGTNFLKEDVIAHPEGVEVAKGTPRASRTRGHLIAEKLFKGEVPKEAREVMDLIQDIGVFRTGKWFEEAGAKIRLPSGDWKPFKADSKRTRWLRRMTPEVYDAIEGDPVFESMAKVLSSWNGVPLEKVRLHLTDSIQGGFIRRDSAETARTFKHFPDRVEVDFKGSKRWVRVLENDPHSALLSWTRHAAMRSSYIKEFGQDIGDKPGETTAGFIRTLKSKHGTIGQTAGERLFKALNGMPLRHRYFAWGSHAGQLVRWFRLWDGLWRSFKLTRAFVPNLPEPLGAPATFFGYSNVLKAYGEVAKAMTTGKLGKLFDDMQEVGIITPDVVDFNIRSGRKIEDVKRVIGSFLYTPTRLVTEMNELVTALSAYKLASKLVKGKGNAMDKIALEGMGFGKGEVSRFMAGKGTPDMNRAIARRGVAFTMGGTSVAGARKSFLANHRAFQSLTFAQDYFQQRTNQMVVILKAMTKKGATPMERLAATAMFAKFFGAATLSGTAAWAILHYWKGDTEQSFRELEEEPLDTAMSIAASSFMGGMMGTAFEAAFGNDPLWEVASKTVTPWQSFWTLASFTTGQGRWRGRGLTEDPLEAVWMLAKELPAIGKDLDRGLFGLTSIALSQHDPVLEQARGAYYRWRRKYEPIPERHGYEKQSELRVAFRRVKDGLARGVQSEALGGLAELLKHKEAKSVGQSLRNWRVFSGADWKALTDEQQMRVLRYIGREGVERLVMQDSLLTQLASSSVLRPLQEAVIRRELTK